MPLLRDSLSFGRFAFGLAPLYIGAAPKTLSPHLLPCKQVFFCFFLPGAQICPGPQVKISRSQANAKKRCFLSLNWFGHLQISSPLHWRVLAIQDLPSEPVTICPKLRPLTLLSRRSLACLDAPCAAFAAYVDLCSSFFLAVSVCRLHASLARFCEEEKKTNSHCFLEMKAFPAEGPSH